MWGQKTISPANVPINQSIEFPSRIPKNVFSSSGSVGAATVRKPASEAAGLPGERLQLDAADLEL